ncbi:MAG: diversity-generating retroelement protein Avd [Candidatus Thiothrix moscowensis]|nr:diversity-generating retroelement protein Avd [Candidatus Thiothrix moscowensis]
MKESPLFVKSYDFVKWLIPQTLKFPRSQRFVVAERLQATAMDFMESLYQATDKSLQAKALKRADVQLKQLRFYLRLSHDLQLLDERRFEHANRLLEEVGRLLGAWCKAVRDT